MWASSLAQLRCPSSILLRSRASQPIWYSGMLRNQIAAHIDANFFNTGSGNWSDDVGGHIGFAPDPSGNVTVFGQISQGNNYFFYLPLGNTSMHTPLRVTLTWDQANHRFLVSWIDLLTKIRTDGVMPYTFGD